MVVGTDAVTYRLLFIVEVLRKSSKSEKQTLSTKCFCTKTKLCSYKPCLMVHSIIISSAHNFGLMNYGVTEPISLKRVALEMRPFSCLMICDE